MPGLPIPISALPPRTLLDGTEQIPCETASITFRIGSQDVANLAPSESIQYNGAFVGARRTLNFRDDGPQTGGGTELTIEDDSINFRINIAIGSATATGLTGDFQFSDGGGGFVSAPAGADHLVFRIDDPLPGINFLFSNASGVSLNNFNCGAWRGGVTPAALFSGDYVGAYEFYGWIEAGFVPIHSTGLNFFGGFTCRYGGDGTTTTNSVLWRYGDNTVAIEAVTDFFGGNTLNITANAIAFSGGTITGLPGVTAVDTDKSVTGGPITGSGTITLVNDQTAPGNSQYYGTDTTGTKGFFALPAGGGGVTAVDTDKSVTGGPITGSGTITLVNDQTAPGNSQYYGTDTTGTKGFFALLAGNVTAVDTDKSVTGGPITGSGTITLVNDQTAPGNSQYYGTDTTGVKGFFPLPAGGGGPVQCWVWFAVSGGAIAAFGGANIASVTYNGVGDYTVNFTAPVPLTSQTLYSTTAAVPPQAVSVSIDNMGGTYCRFVFGAGFPTDIATLTAIFLN